MNGIVRGVDRQRRVVIPKEQLKAAGIGPGDLLGIYSDVSADGVPIIILSKYESGCSLCGGELDQYAKEINHHHVCRKCINQLKKGEEPCQKHQENTLFQDQ